MATFSPGEGLFALPPRPYSRCLLCKVLAKIENAPIQRERERERERERPTLVSAVVKIISVHGVEASENIFH